jgi:hypothetical protein
MGEMRIMGKEGDVKVIWDKNKDVEVMVAKEQFEKLMEEGYTAFEVGRTGRKTSKKVEEFDADLGSLIMVPKIAGG